MSGSGCERITACWLPKAASLSAFVVSIAVVGLLLSDSTSSASVFVDRPAVTNLEYAVDVGTWCGEAIEERGLVFGVTNIFLPKCKSPRGHLVDLKSWAVSALSSFVPNNINFGSYYGVASTYWWTSNSWASTDGVTIASLGECASNRITSGYWIPSEPRTSPRWTLQSLTFDVLLPHEQVIWTGHVIRTAGPKYPGWMFGQFNEQWGEGDLVSTQCTKGYFDWTPERSGAMYGAGVAQTNAWQWFYYPYDGTDPIAPGFTDADYGYGRIEDVFKALTITAMDGCPYQWIVKTRIPDTNGIPGTCYYMPGHYWRYTGSWPFDPYNICWNGEWTINGRVEQTYSCTPWSPSSYWWSNVVSSTALPHVYWYWDERAYTEGSYSLFQGGSFPSNWTASKIYTWVAGHYWQSYHQKTEAALSYTLPCALTADCTSVVLGFAEPYTEEAYGGYRGGYHGCMPANGGVYFNLSDGRLAARSVVFLGNVRGTARVTNAFEPYHSMSAFRLECEGESCSGMATNSGAYEGPPGYMNWWDESESWTAYSYRREDRVPAENTHYYLFADWAFQYR